jgi:hypothetical protein
MKATSALLLDLDGVVVFEAGPPLLETREILALHDDLPGALAALGLPVVVLTHRSRREAAVILDAVGLPTEALARLIAAEDLFAEGVRRRRFGQLLRGGLRKSLALKLAEQATGAKREHMAFIDDRQGNLEDVLSKGVAMGLHAPSYLDPDGSGLVTFDLSQAMQLLADWAAGRTAGTMVALDPQSRPVASFRRTGFDTTRHDDHFFNRARRTAFRMRRAMGGAG